MSFIFAPAKLTLGFRVTGIRSDGYHLIESEMTMVNFGDDIEVVEVFDRTAGKRSHFEVMDPENMSKFGFGFRQVPTAEDNLLDKVASIFGKGLKARINKRIPVGGGLGGGSADGGALARLLWSAERELAGLSIEEMVTKLAKLGADLPVCFFGRRSYVSGIGEVLSFPDGPPPIALRKFTLFLAPISISTPAAYSAFDEGNRVTVASGEFQNDLEGPALAISGRLRSFRETIEKRFGVTPSLAGSGSTYFVSGHVLDQLLVEDLSKSSNAKGQQDGVRCMPFSDINDQAMSYLAWQCEEIELNF
ncbi:MAG: hypothetical protein M0T78_03180 [Actinomycetota bacterium]|nr:hypothetical protein [Actinomycetota bacterium]